jgi:hypothetical protein
VTVAARTYLRNSRRVDHALLEKLLQNHLSPSSSIVDEVHTECRTVPRITAEFWTSRQRQSSSLHEISYRACFKAQLPRFFIDRFSLPGDVVYDPFMGRGTTLIEAALQGRRAWGNDINPLSKILARPRLQPPDIDEVRRRLSSIRLSAKGHAAVDLSMFYHPRTEAAIVSLRKYLLARRHAGSLDAVDRWIRMVATNRLTGHSRGFFSVYTLPPNQALSPDNQIRINRMRRQKPEYRDVSELILRKTKSLLRNLSEQEYSNLAAVSREARCITLPAWRTKTIDNDSVHLTVTSPPFLDIVNYAQDNWLRCWFNGIDHRQVSRRMTVVRLLEDWEDAMGRVFSELHRITVPEGVVAFEVGEIRNRNLNLDEVVVPLGHQAGFRCVAVLINQQRFTKTSNIWGISNNKSGTNTNRIVVFQKSRKHH